jgi:hypothetical protein
MSDRERLLRGALGDARAGDEGAAEERALRVVLAAGASEADDGIRARRGRGGRRLAQVAIALALVALLVSPAGASVRHWVADRIDQPGAPHAKPVLSSLPGAGSLLVDSTQGPWVVHPDGTKRLLGDYAEASWSPHGLFAVVTGGHELAAVEPDGTVRWTLTRPGRVRLARWNGPDGFRIAYLEGGALRVVDGEGGEDRRIAGGVASVAPAWRAGTAHELAYATRRGAVVAVGADSRREAFATTAGPAVTSLQWVGTRLLVTRPGLVQLLAADGRPLRSWTPPPGSRFRSATAAPRGGRIAAVAIDGRASRVILLRLHGPQRVLFAGPGRFAASRWSPDARWLLLPWPSADQWLFLQPGSGTGKLHAVAHVAAQFSPGDPAGARFPTVVGWCCTRH